MTQYPDIRLRKCIDPSGKIDWFEVTEDCWYNGLIIEAGYCTDMASVPRWLWSIIPPHGLMANASIIHDYMYDKRFMEDTYGAEMARLQADLHFIWNCKVDGVSTSQALFVFLILRLWGRKWWVN